MSGANDSIPENWDPMREDYHDSKFNSFLQGPGKRLSNIQPGNRDRSQEYKLQVQQIPEDLTNQGLLNLFSPFGDVKIIHRAKCQFSPSFSVAYVLFYSQIAANRAIKELHKEPPFHLKVQYAKNKEKARSPNSEIVAFHSNTDEVIIENIPKTSEKKKNIYDGAKVEEIISKFYPPKHYFPFILHNNFDPMYSNPYVDFHHEKYKIYYALDEIYSKTVDKKHEFVSMGSRFHSDSNFKNTPPSKNFEFGNKTRSEHQSLNSGSCSFCSKEAACTCKLCGAFYCSRKCQMDDWSSHKSNCSKKSSGNSESKALVLLKVTFVGEDVIYVRKVEDENRFLNFRKLLQEKCPSEDRFCISKKGEVPVFIRNRSKCAVFDEENKEWCRGVFMDASALSHTIFFMDYGFTKACSPTSTKWLNSDLAKDKSFAFKLKLSSGKYDSLSIGDIIKVDSLETKTGFFEAVLKEICENKAKSVVGSVLSTEFFPKISVKLINLSSEEFTTVKIIARLCDSTYAVSWIQITVDSKYSKEVNGVIKIDTEAIYERGSKLRVRCINRLSSDFFIVEAESDDVQKDDLRSKLNLSRLKTQTSNVLPKCIIEYFEIDDKGAFSVGCVLRRDEFTACVINSHCNQRPRFVKRCGKLLFNALQDEMAESSENPDFIPMIGDLVGVFDKNYNMWSRGVVWSVSTLVRCALIDLGRIISVPLKDVRPLEKQYAELPSLSVFCKVSNVKCEKSFEKLLTCQDDLNPLFIVESKLNGSLVLSVNDGSTEEQTICQLEIRNWSPTCEEIGLKAVDFSSKKDFRLTHFCNVNVMYITPVNNLNFILNKKIVQLTHRAQPMTRVPRFGELVALRWKNQYARAQIFEPFGSDQFRLFYVDIGAQDIQKLGEVFELSDELKSFPTLAIKVSLKSVENVSLPNVNMITYLNKLGINEDVLKVSLENNDLSAVELHLTNNDTVSERINHYFKSGNEKCDKKDDEIYIDCIDYHKLKEDVFIEVGLLSKLNGSYVMIETKAPSVEFIFTVLQSLMNEYCEKITKEGFNGYYPRENEVVFAEYSDDEKSEKKNWCRAVVLRNAHLGSAVVSFLDTGAVGEILHSSMRKMNRRFVEVPAAATAITVEFPKGLTEQVEKSIPKFFRNFTSYTCKAKEEADFQYTAYFPFLDEILRKHYGYRP